MTNSTRAAWPANIVGAAVGWMRERGLERTTAFGAGWSLAVRAAGMVVAFGVQSVLARRIGQEGYGRYVYVLAWMNVAMLFAKLEFDTLGLRFIGSYAGTQQWALLQGFLKKTQYLTLLLSGGTAVVATVGLLVMRASVEPMLFTAAVWACALLVPTALLTVQGGFLQGFQRMVAAQAPSQLLRPLAFGAILGVFIWRLGSGVRAWHAVLANLCATVLAVLVSTYYLNRSTPLGAHTVKPEYDLPLWMRTSSGLMVIAAAQLMMSMQSDVVIVGSIMGTSVAGIYSIASQVASIVSFAPIALTAVAIPQLASLHAKSDMKALQRLLQLMLLTTLAMTLPVLLAVLLWGHTLLGLFGPAFTSGYQVMFILSFNQAASAVVGVAGGYLLTMTGHERAAAKIIVATSVLNLALSLALTKGFGTAGAAIATSASTFIRCGWLFVFARRELSLDLLPLKWWKHAA